MKQINVKWILAVLLMTVLLTAGLALAAGELMPRSLVSSGGGLVSEAGYTVHSAIGQPVVGAVTNEATLCSGFLCGPGAPPAPPINIEYNSFLPVMIRQ